MKKNTRDFRLIDHNRMKIPDLKLLSGSLTGKYPIVLDGGRTTIFIDDLSKEDEIRERYELRRDSRVNIFVKKPKL